MRRLSNLFFLMALVILGMALFAVVARVGEQSDGVAGAGKGTPIESFELVQVAPVVDLALRHVPAILRR